MLNHYLDIGKNQIEIARLLKWNKYSISKELKRDILNGEYFSSVIQSNYFQMRLCSKPKGKNVIYFCINM